MRVRGRSKVWPRSFWARWGCDTPSPSTKRPPVASWSVIAAIRVVWASCPQMLTMLVPMRTSRVSAASRPRSVNGSRPTVSGTQSVP